MRNTMKALVAGTALVAATLATPFAGTATAADNACKNGTIGGIAGTPAVKGNIVVPIGSHPYVLYLDVREVLGHQYDFSIWAYLEDNGKVNLQRGGDVTIDPTGTLSGQENCPDSGPPDMLIF